MDKNNDFNKGYSYENFNKYSDESFNKYSDEKFNEYSNKKFNEYSNKKFNADKYFKSDITFIIFIIQVIFCVGIALFIVYEDIKASSIKKDYIKECIGETVDVREYTNNLIKENYLYEDTQNF